MEEISNVFILVEFIGMSWSEWWWRLIWICGAFKWTRMYRQPGWASRKIYKAKKPNEISLLSFISFRFYSSGTTHCFEFEDELKVKPIALNRKWNSMSQQVLHTTKRKWKKVKAWKRKITSLKKKNLCNRKFSIDLSFW